MTYFMASLIKKTIRGRAYYYARECRRVHGKPTIVWQKYLGRADDIIAALAPSRPTTQPPLRRREAVITEFGAVVALYDIAQQLQLSDHIDRHVPKAGSGPSVGTYLLIAAINRCVAPCSKVRLARWFEGTALRRLLEVRTEQLTSQRFWDHMARVSAQAIELIERDLTSHLVRRFDLDRSPAQSVRDASSRRQPQSSSRRNPIRCRVPGPWTIRDRGVVCSPRTGPPEMGVPH
jgi:hypothetical protein